ncbi:hypothetical protein ABTL03_19415, partial [Acinetobacter baumannii]
DDAVCDEQPMDGARAVAGSAGMSASAMRLRAVVAIETKRPQAQIALRLPASSASRNGNPAGNLIERYERRFADHP